MSWGHWREATPAGNLLNSVGLSASGHLPTSASGVCRGSLLVLILCPGGDTHFGERVPSVNY